MTVYCPQPEPVWSLLILKLTSSNSGLKPKTNKRSGTWVCPGVAFQSELCLQLVYKSPGSDLTKEKEKRPRLDGDAHRGHHGLDDGRHVSLLLQQQRQAQFHGRGSAQPNLGGRVHHQRDDELRPAHCRFSHPGWHLLQHPANTATVAWLLVRRTEASQNTSRNFECLCDCWLLSIGSFRCW